MVSMLGPLLKKEHEDRLQYIEWELDDIVEELLKPEEEQEESEDEQDEQQEDHELEFDLERVKQERRDEVEEDGCGKCRAPLSPSTTFSCLRVHKLCGGCR